MQCNMGDVGAHVLCPGVHRQRRRPISRGGELIGNSTEGKSKVTVLGKKGLKSLKVDVFIFINMHKHTFKALGKRHESMD